MASMLRKIFAPVALAAAVVGLAGCGENPQDLAAKPAVVQQMVENSASICNTGPVHADNAAYAQRLTKLLSAVPTASLKTLQSKNVTVCLDQRLQYQTRGFWDSTLEGVYYPGKDGGGIMTYRDNGMQPAEETFWHGNPTSYYGPGAVNRLARYAAKGELPGQGGLLKAQIYGGKSRYADWATANPAKGVLAQNPQFQQPPVKAPMAKPGV